MESKLVPLKMCVVRIWYPAGGLPSGGDPSQKHKDITDNVLISLPYALKNDINVFGKMSGTL